jgi:type VI secretion system protein ImpK
MYRASAEVLLAAARLGEARSLPSAEVLRQDMLGVLRDLVTRCRAAGIPDAETAEARYAIVAFIDERVLHSNWPGRTEWMSNPLQLQLYREYAAGENFFARMRVLLHRGTPSPALEVYYLCLALGFTGAMPGAGGVQAGRSYLDAAREPLVRSGQGVPISPHGIPPDRYPSRPRGHALAIPLVLACAAVAILGLLGLWWALEKNLDRVRHDMAAAEPAPVRPADSGR